MSNTVSAHGEAAPVTLKIPIITLTPETIAAMSMDERRSFYDALRLAETALGGIIHQPRFYKANERSLNKAGDAVDDLQEFMIDAIDLLIKVMRAEEPVDPKDLEIRAWLDLRYEADCGDNLPEFVVIAAQAAVAVADAELGAKRGRH